MFKRIVAGVYPSDSAQRAADRAIELAETMGAELHLVCAYATGESSASLSSVVGDAALAKGGYPRPVPPRAGDQRTHAEQFLASVAHATSAKTRTHALPGDAADAILQVAEEMSADLVVVGNVGMKGARRVLGSIPNTISHHAPCAVLIVHTV